MADLAPGAGTNPTKLPGDTGVSGAPGDGGPAAQKRGVSPAAVQTTDVKVVPRASEGRSETAGPGADAGRGEGGADHAAGGVSDGAMAGAGAGAATATAGATDGADGVYRAGLMEANADVLGVRHRLATLVMTLNGLCVPPPGVETGPGDTPAGFEGDGDRKRPSSVDTTEIVAHAKELCELVLQVTMRLPRRTLLALSTSVASTPSVGDDGSLRLTVGKSRGGGADDDASTETPTATQAALGTAGSQFGGSSGYDPSHPPGAGWEDGSTADQWHLITSVLLDSKCLRLLCWFVPDAAAAIPGATPEDVRMLARVALAAMRGVATSAVSRPRSVLRRYNAVPALLAHLVGQHKAVVAHRKASGGSSGGAPGGGGSGAGSGVSGSGDAGAGGGKRGTDGDADGDGGSFLRPDVVNTIVCIRHLLSRRALTRAPPVGTAPYTDAEVIEAIFEFTRALDLQSQKGDASAAGGVSESRSDTGSISQGSEEAAAANDTMMEDAFASMSGMVRHAFIDARAGMDALLQMATEGPHWARTTASVAMARTIAECDSPQPAAYAASASASSTSNSTSSSGAAAASGAAAGAGSGSDAGGRSTPPSSVSVLGVLARMVHDGSDVEREHAAAAFARIAAVLAREGSNSRAHAASVASSAPSGGKLPSFTAGVDTRDSQCGAVRDAGAVQPLIGTLVDGTERARRSAVSALVTLGTDGDAGRRAVIPLIVAMLSARLSGTMMLPGTDLVAPPADLLLRVLSSLAEGGPLEREEILSCGGRQALSLAATAGGPLAHASALQLLALLMVAESRLVDANSPAAGGGGAASASGSGGAAATTAQVSVPLTRSADPAVAAAPAQLREQSAKQREEEDDLVLVALINALGDMDPVAQGCARGVLRSLASNEPQNEHLVARLHEELVACMLDDDASLVSVVNAARVTYDVLSKQPAAKAMLRRAGAGLALERVSWRCLASAVGREEAEVAEGALRLLNEGEPVETKCCKCCTIM